MKPTERRPRSTFVSLQRLGPAWKGPALRLQRPDALGLRFPVVIGWSDFYGGIPAPVGVARATDGERSGWVVWGGSQGLRAVACEEGDEAAFATATYEERPLLWVPDPGLLPAHVAAVVASGGVAARSAEVTVPAVAAT
ncbi:MAG: hypothetical protein P1P87_07140 [Trueperaceae bacterium]|nr:hypothetical protein [Trueperaceae bacterium]